MQKLRIAALMLCLLGVSTAVAAQNQPIVGHQNLKLGMTIEEALAAEPLAQLLRDCEQHSCLSYFDRRFLGTGFNVLAGFSAENRLESIAMSVVLAGGGAVRCADFYRSAFKDYTGAHGAPERITGTVVTWEDASAVITVTRGCNAGADSTIDVAIDRRR